MGLSRQTMTEIHSLSVEEGEDSGIPLLKQQTTPRAAHLLISVGGSGADMIRETKGLIDQNCCSDYDKHLAPERVAYIAFDTNASEKVKTSGRATGRVKLTDDELTILSDTGLAILLDPAMRDRNRAVFQWIYRWLDTRIPMIVGQNGAGGIRQAGRAILFLEMDKVINRLRTTIIDLIRHNDVQSLNIYLLSGVSGGTGGGMFLDMAYIVREIANEVIGAGVFRRMNMRFFSYLIMPDVNLCNADTLIRPMIFQNAGAALQELDHAMRLPEIGDYYECQYSNNFTVRTNRRPFDYVYLISARPRTAGLPNDPYQHCLDTVAGSILCFVSGQTDAGVNYNGGPRGQITFPVDSYYNNIEIKNSMAATCKLYKERSSCYLSIGCACWQIPGDMLVKYIFTQMFKKVSGLFANEPSRDDAYDLFNLLGLGCEQKVMDFMGKLRKPLNPAQYTAKDLFGKNAVSLEDYLPYDDCIKEIDKIFINSIEDYGKNIKSQLQQAFIDPNKGPIWTNHVVVQGAASTIPIIALERLIRDEKNAAIVKRRASQSAADALLTDINRMRNTNRIFVGPQKRKEYVEAWNNYFNEILKVHCYDLLIGNTKTLKSFGNQHAYGFYDEAQNITADLNNQWLDVTRQVLEELKNIVQKNTDAFRKAALKDTGRGFRWSTGGIPNLDKVIGDVISENEVDQARMMSRFLNKLLEKADEWSQSVDIRKFIEEFLETEAQDVLKVSLEGLLASCFDDSKPLSVSVRDALMPYMTKSAQPLFDGDMDRSYAAFITIPGGCKQILNGVNQFAGGKPDFNINTIYLRNRISVICTSVGISMHDYTYYEECEKAISANPNAIGLFLNQGEEDVAGRVNHMEMPLPFIIPARKRGVLNPAPERFARYEKDLLKEFREMVDGKYPFLSLEKTLDGRDYNLYLNLSVNLDQAGLAKMIHEEHYKNYRGDVDPDKLKNLIEDLKEIRYSTGLPRKTDLPNRLTICENILASSTMEQRDRWHDVFPEQEEEIKRAVAWEIAEWYYTSAYSFYMRAKEEKAKYDEVQNKIDELNKVLEQIEQKPVSMFLKDSGWKCPKCGQEGNPGNYCFICGTPKPVIKA